MVRDASPAATPAGKGRVFLRFAVFQQALPDYLADILQNRAFVRDWYSRDAVMANQGTSLCVCWGGVAGIVTAKA